MNDYKKVLDVYSEQQLSKAHEIVSLMLECVVDAAKEEPNFKDDVKKVEFVQRRLEDLINADA